jgi:hypothetical protein
MKELVKKLVESADLSPDQAEKVASVVRGFLGDRLPEAIQGPVMAALSGDNVESAADQAKDLLGKLF